MAADLDRSNALLKTAVMKPATHDAPQLAARTGRSLRHAHVTGPVTGYIWGSVPVVRRDPLGVCALIAPWKFPINLVVIKLAPALLDGCTVQTGPAQAAVHLGDHRRSTCRRGQSGHRDTGQTCYISTKILAPGRRYDGVVHMVAWAPNSELRA